MKSLLFDCCFTLTSPKLMCWNLEQCAKSAFPHLVAFARVFQQSNGAGSYDPYILWSHNEYGLAISNPEEATWKEKQSTLSPKVMRTATTWWIFLEFCSCVCVCEGALCATPLTRKRSLELIIDLPHTPWTLLMVHWALLIGSLSDIWLFPWLATREACLKCSKAYQGAGRFPEPPASQVPRADKGNPR